MVHDLLCSHVLLRRLFELGTIRLHVVCSVAFHPSAHRESIFRFCLLSENKEEDVFEKLTPGLAEIVTLVDDLR